MFRRILKYCLSFLAGMTAIVLLAIVLALTPWGRGMLLNAALDAVNSSISGEIRVGDLKGNLFSGVELRSLSLSLEGAPVIRIAAVRVEYDLGDLLQSRITVRHLVIDSVSITLRKEEGMQWNLERAMQSRMTDETQQGQGGVFGWRVAVDSLMIANLAATAIAEDTLASVSDLSLLGAGTYSAESLVVLCRQMAIKAENPRVELERCTFILKMDSTHLFLDKIAVKTKANSVSGHVGFGLRNEELTFDVATGPLYPKEFRGLTGDIPLTGHPLVHLAGNYVSNTLAVRADVQRGQERVGLDIEVTTGPDLIYSVRGTVHEFNVGDFTGDPMLITPLSGDFAFSGKGLIPGRMTAEGTISLADVRLKGYDLGAVETIFTLKEENASAQLKSDGPYGLLAAEGLMSHVTGSREFSARVVVTDLDLLRLSGVHTNVSAGIDVRGVLSGPSGPVFALNVEADSILVDTVRIDRFVGAMEYDGTTFRVDSITVSRTGTEVLTRGTIDTTGYFDIAFRARVNELSRLVPASGLDSLGGTAAVTGSASGTLRHFSTAVAVEAANIAIDGSQVGDLGCRIVATIVRDSVTLVSAESLRIAWNDTIWNTTDTLTLVLGEDSLALEPITFVSGEQQITIGGNSARNGEGDLSVLVRRVNIGSFNRVIPGPVLAGIIDIDLRAHGSKRGVDGNLTLLLDRGMYGELILPQVRLHAEAKDSTLQWAVDLEAHAGSLHGVGTLPLGFPDTAGTGLIARDRPFSASFITEQFDLSMLSVLEATPVMASGYLNGRIDIGGTISSPMVEGFIRLDSGAVTYTALGMDYSGIQLKLSGNGESLVLEEFSAEQGAVTGSGSIAFAYVDSLSIRPDITFRAKNFEVLTGPPHFATIDGDVRVHGDEEGSVIFESDITLNRSRFFLPALQSAGPEKDQDPPLLLAAAEKADTGTIVKADSASRGVRLPGFKGKATLRILRGTWLRGPRLNIELSGNLEVTPEGDLMTVRGFLVVEQGTYEFYGRKFVFNQGRIDFDGGTSIDPSIFFEVEYTFRTEAGENEMLITVRGRAEKPEVQFFFNKDRISESDAISYIIFGRKVDDLNYGQKSTVSDLGNALALDLAANMINAQLSSMVGDKLGLDVVRVSGEDNWNKAVLTAGKYVTDELFVAYERGISQSGSSSVVFESARLEYYLMKFLYLHLIEATDKTSGIDVFLKFD